MNLFSHPEQATPVHAPPPPARPDPVVEALRREAHALQTPAHAPAPAPTPAPAAPRGAPERQGSVPGPRRPRRAKTGEPTGPAARTPGLHPCPGCGTDVFDHLLACRGCWARLPRVQRERVVHGWTRDAMVAANALVEAVSWWRTHPR